MGGSASQTVTNDQNTPSNADNYEHLKCSNCDKYLSVLPILSCPRGLINICGRDPCNQHTTTNNGQYLQRNTTYEEAAKLLIFPCSASKSCREKLRWDKVLNHESVCPHRIICCPADHCVEVIQIKDADVHFKAKHHELFIDENKKLFSFHEWNSSNNNLGLNQQLCFFKTKHIRILFYIKLENNTTLLFNCFSLNPIENANYEYVLKFENFENKCSFHKSYTIALLPTTVLCNSKDLNHVSQKTLDVSRAIDAIGNFNNVTIEVMDPKAFAPCKIDIGNISASFQSLLSSFDCPVCYLFMDAGISLCKIGHSVCSKCRSQLTKCPICQSNFQGGDVRNYKLEEIAGNLNALKLWRWNK